MNTLNKLFLLLFLGLCGQNRIWALSERLVPRSNCDPYNISFINRGNEVKFFTCVRNFEAKAYNNAKQYNTKPQRKITQEQSLLWKKVALRGIYGGITVITATFLACCFDNHK